MQSNVTFNTVELFSNNNINVLIDVVIRDNNIWMTKEQMCSVFDVHVRIISKHINNIFIEREFDRQLHVKNWFIKKKYTRTQFFSLDIVVCVMGRLRATVAQWFRQWSNMILKQIILDKLHRLNNHRSSIEPLDKKQKLINIIEDFDCTWTSILQYDKSELDQNSYVSTQVINKPNYTEIVESINILRARLSNKQETTKYFGVEANIGKFEQIFNLVFEDKSKSFEEKASLILYAIIKEKPFIDGNKRIACFIFMQYILANIYLSEFNNVTLTSLALLIEESNEHQKDNILMLVRNFLAVKKV